MKGRPVLSLKIAPKNTKNKNDIRDKNKSINFVVGTVPK